MASNGTAAAVPEVALRSGNARLMPVVGMGTAASPLVPEATKLERRAGCHRGGLPPLRHRLHVRHGEAARRRRGRGGAARARVASREEMFVTSKLWCTQYHPALALPDLRQTLQYESPKPAAADGLMEYLDLYLIHWPVCIKPVPPSFPAKKEDAMPFDFERACGSSGR
uniref:NADP-dependent oxidoreductase domain-containing protein n=1 Tax=Setaria italica TaxID=4555 RepID=K3YEV1_SETIT